MSISKDIPTRTDGSLAPTTARRRAPGAPATAQDAPAPVRVTRVYHLRRLLGVTDCLAIAVSFVLSLVVFGHHHHEVRDIVVTVASLPFWVLLFKLYGLYDADGKRISHSTVDDLPWVFHAMVFGALGLWTVFREGPLDTVSLSEFIAFVALGTMTVLSARNLARALTRALIGPERVLVVADSALTSLLARKMRGHPEYHLQPVGYLADRDDGMIGDIAWVGALADFEAVCATHAVERIIAGPDLVQDRMIELVRTASVLGVPVNLVPSLVDVLGPSVEVDDLEGVTILGINPPRLTRSSRALKRAMDITVCLTAGVLLAPLMIAIALVVRFTSPGPALFSQERVGRRGRHFRLYKFRTMVKDAEGMAAELRQLSADPDWLLLERDPRITRVGAFLRTTSLDELPQLYNVLRGDMSLVGPRPLSLTDHDNVSDWGRRRLDLTPGITGVWQVLGRTRIPFAEMVKLDYLYVTNWSLWGDVRLLIRTLPTVLRRRGAN